MTPVFDGSPMLTDMRAPWRQPFLFLERPPLPVVHAMPSTTMVSVAHWLSTKTGLERGHAFVRGVDLEQMCYYFSGATE
jgi:hypothetical protein